MTAIRATAAFALVIIGTRVGLSTSHITGWTLLGLLLIAAGGAWGVVLYTRKATP